MGWRDFIIRIAFFAPSVMARDEIVAPVIAWMSLSSSMGSSAHFPVN